MMTKNGVAAKIGLGFEAEQGVEDAAVAQVDFGAFDEALFEIGEQGGEAEQGLCLGCAGLKTS
jgi:hypothetical protein